MGLAAKRIVHTVGVAVDRAPVYGHKSTEPSLEDGCGYGVTQRKQDMIQCFVQKYHMPMEHSARHWIRSLRMGSDWVMGHRQ